MKSIFLFAAMCLLFFVAGCSDPKDTPIPGNLTAWESNAKLQKAINKLTPDEKSLFIQYVLRTGISGALGGAGIPVGMTVGGAIEAQKKWKIDKELEEARQKALAEELKAKREAILVQMRELATVTLLDLGFIPSDFQSGRIRDQIKIKLGIKNNSSKNLVGIKGSTLFDDIFGDKILNINFSIDENIAAGATAIYSGVIDYNQFIAGHKKLINTESEKIKFSWQPAVYLFDDGSKLETNAF
jgi:hypothetical protein